MDLNFLSYFKKRIWCAYKNVIFIVSKKKRDTNCRYPKTMTILCPISCKKHLQISFVFQCIFLLLYASKIAQNGLLLKKNRINNRYVFCCNKRWRHLSVPFCGLKNKSKPRWCLAVSTVFNKRSFTTILRIVMVIYPKTLDPLKKYRKPEWLDDLFTPYFVHHNRHLRSIFGYLKINKKICIQNWCVIPVYLHIIDITWHFGVFDLTM